MLGLVLEGGGAKGSYQAGALKALYEKGYKFDGVMGTSIGAINGAFVAQGTEEKCFDFWENISPSKISDLDDSIMQRLFDRKFDKETVFYLFKIIKDVLLNRGIPTEKVKVFLKGLIDEDLLRKSKIDFGLVTVSLTDKMPMEIFKEEIPYGMIVDYIMASAYYPAFRIDPIQGKMYLDGGAYDNLPINPLIRRGCDEIIAIRTLSKMPHQQVVDDTIKITYIIPSDDVGKTINMNASSIEKNMKMGYYDAKRVLENHKGKKFYFTNKNNNEFHSFLLGLQEEVFEGWKKCLNLDNATDKPQVINSVLKTIRKEMKCSYILDDYELFLNFLEKCAKRYDIERFMLYNVENFLILMKNQYQQNKGDSAMRSHRSFIINSTLNNIFAALINNYK